MYIGGRGGGNQGQRHLQVVVADEDDDDDDAHHIDDGYYGRWFATRGHDDECITSSPPSPPQSSVPKLIELCEQFIGINLPLYGLASKLGGETGEAIDDLFSIIPAQSLERISLAASYEDAVDDNGLMLLCQPSVRTLVLSGQYSDAGLAG